MISELHTQLIKKFEVFQDLLAEPSEKKENTQWAGRSVSKSTAIKSEIKRLLVPENNEDITDIQLLDRVCTLCDVEPGKKETLRMFCGISVEIAAKALTEILVDTITKKPNSEELFNHELEDWVEKGEEGENRTKAAELIIQAYKYNSEKLDLSSLGLKSLPIVISQLTHVKSLTFSKNDLKTLPYIFEDLPALKTINLDNNPFKHFPKALHALENNYVTVNIDNTPITFTFLTPGIKRKMCDNHWIISRLSNTKDLKAKAFENSCYPYEQLLKNSKDLGLRPIDFIKCQRVTPNITLKKETEETLLHIQKNKQTRVQTQQDLKEKLSPLDLTKVRLLNLENNGSKINLFGLATPYKKFLNVDDDSAVTVKRTDEEIIQDNIRAHAVNQPFLFSEIDTLITLVDRDENNEPNSSIKDYAGSNMIHPIKKVFSIPIPDFQPPRFEHYLTLTEEMNITSPSDKPKGIAIFCGFGEGRTGTLLAASQVINEFKKLDTESKKKLLNTTRNFTPEISGGHFTFLKKDFKTTEFVGNIVQNLRKHEQETTIKKGISVETPAQFESLEILQCMLAISEMLKDTPPVSDEQILEFINDQNFSPEPLEEFFQIDYSRPAEEVILESVKLLHASFSKTSSEEHKG